MLHLFVQNLLTRWAEFTHWYHAHTDEARDIEANRLALLRNILKGE